MADTEETPEQRRERWRSITVGGRAPGTKPADPNHIRPMQQPVWEATKVYEDRPGGFKIPVVHPDGQPVTVKQYANNRKGYDTQRDKLRNDPNVFSER